MKPEYYNREHDEPEAFDRLSDDEQLQLLNWIDRNFSPRSTFNTRHTSYGLKHLFESDGGFYVYNGAFKGAMVKSGYRVQDPNALNWCFNISQKSTALHLKPKH